MDCPNWVSGWRKIFANLSIFSEPLVFKQTCFDPWLIPPYLPMLTLLELGKGWKLVDIRAVGEYGQDFLFSQRRVSWQKYSSSKNGWAKCTTVPNYRPMDEDMAHQTMLIILFCQAFKLGQDLSLKHLNSLLLIPLLKCLQNNKTNV